jgi:hypothetical protein
MLAGGGEGGGGVVKEPEVSSILLYADEMGGLRKAVGLTTLRISDLVIILQCCGSEMFIPDRLFPAPDPGSKRHRNLIRDKELKFFTQQNCY